jgi:hypothetical protein
MNNSKEKSIKLIEQSDKDFIIMGINSYISHLYKELECYKKQNKDYMVEFTKNNISKYSEKRDKYARLLKC